MAPFYGTVSMAFLTVGSGALLAAKPLIGLDAGLALDATLWSIGAAIGLACALAIPYLTFTLQRPRLEDVGASWLLPVVPPVVAASAGAGLIAHMPSGQLRLSLELICGAFFGISVLMSAVLVVLLWARLALHGLPSATLVPSLWLVLGPLGQSITAAALLAHDSGSAVATDIALLYGVAVWGFAIAWLAIAATLTLRTARQHLPFSLTWWSFTFPLGTVVTGTSELALHLHADVFRDGAAVLFLMLLAAWLTVAFRTLRGTLDASLFA